MELSDLRARTVCVSSRTPVETAIDALLRMQNCINWKTPITMYLGVGNAETHPLGILNVVTMCDVMRSLRSPIHTFAFGLVSGAEPLLLAAGARGHRHVLPHTIINVGPIEPDKMFLPNGDVGLTQNHHQSSPRTNAQTLLLEHVHQLSRELRLSPDLWTKSKILSGSEILKAGLADTVLPARSPDLRIAPSQRNSTTIVKHEL